MNCHGLTLTVSHSLKSQPRVLKSENQHTRSEKTKQSPYLPPPNPSPPPPYKSESELSHTPHTFLVLSRHRFCIVPSLQLWHSLSTL
ncbi:hypothetical protein P8452_53592 [Trifolium repens]|nr:hypothetical protein P8452_53592 [Trifolium repens]